MIGTVSCLSLPRKGWIPGWVFPVPAPATAGEMFGVVQLRNETLRDVVGWGGGGMVCCMGAGKPAYRSVLRFSAFSLFDYPLPSLQITTHKAPKLDTGIMDGNDPVSGGRIQ